MAPTGNTRDISDNGSVAGVYSIVTDSPQGLQNTLDETVNHQISRARAVASLAKVTFFALFFLKSSILSLIF
jgi:hypothetical protein